MKVENVEIEETQSSTSISCRLEVKSSTIDYQNCPICLCPFDSDALARLDACSHKFCFDCIQEWSKKINTCPIDRKKYTYIEFRTKKGLTKRIKVEDRTNLEQEEGPNDLTYCEVCHLSNREDRMLLCDGCDRGFHCECLRPAIENIPNGDWYCPRCVEIRTSVNDSFHHDHFSSEIGPTTSQRAEQRQQQPRIIARTNYAERVRRNVSQRRKTTKTARRKPKQRRKKRKVGVKRRRTTTRKTTTKKRVVKKTSTKLSASRLASIKKVRTYRRRRKTTKKRKTGSSAIKRRTLTLNSIKIKRKVLNRPKQRIITKFIRKSDEKKVFNPRAPAETALVNNVTSDLMSDYVFRDLPCTSRDSDLNSDLKPKNIPMATTNQQQPKTSSSSSSSLNLFDSILSDFKLLHKKSEEIQVKTDGSLNVVNRPKLTLKSVNSISSTSESLIKRLKREDSNGESKTSVEVNKNEPTSHDLRSSHSHSQEITTSILQRQKSSSNPSTSTTAQNTSQTKIKKEFSIKEEKLDDELKSQKLNQQNKNKPASDENQSSSKKIRKEHPLTEAIILGYQKPTTSAAANLNDTNTIMKPTSHSVNQTKIKREFSIKDEKLPLPVNNGKTHEQMKSQINSNTATKPTENMAVNHQIKIKEEKLAPEELTNKINQENNKAENQASSKQIKQEAVENEEPLTEASILGFDKPTKTHRSKNNDDQSTVKTVAIKVEKVEPSTSKQATVLSRDRIIEIAKETLKPFYVKQLINKDTYKYIMKRVVEKTMEQIQQGSSSICEDKIAKLVKQYVEKSSAHKS